MTRYGAKSVTMEDTFGETIVMTYWAGPSVDDDRITFSFDDGDDEGCHPETAPRLASALEELIDWSKTLEGKKRVAAMRKKAKAA